MIGRTLGPYEVVAKLGEGGMGEVYRARDTRLNRDVAIKVLPASVAQDPDRRARFEREAQAVAALSHPNVLAVFDTGFAAAADDTGPESRGSSMLYVVTELLEGESLRQRLQSGGALPVRKAIDIAGQIARGLAAAHGKGIVHRDLKPDNVFLLADGQVKILDFGLAKAIGAEATGPAAATAETKAAMTEPGLVMGTVGYMAPEQVRGQDVDARADLFSLGTVLYEMVAGERAFAGASTADTMTAILREDPPELAGSRPDLSPALDRIIRHCLEKNPAERFQTARDVAFALEALSGATTTASTTMPVVADGPARARLRRWPVAIAGIVAIAAAVGLGWWLRPARASVRFDLKTFDRMRVFNARYMPDGQSVVYDAAYNRAVPEVFVLRPDTATPQPVAGPGSHLLSVSSKGELAILTDAVSIGHRLFTGTLARLTPGAAPREWMTGVREADWAPDGESLAVIKDLGNGSDQLEYPEGTALYDARGYLSDVRVSHDGSHVAFVEHAIRFDDRGTVKSVDRGKRITELTPELGAIQGVAWSPDDAAVFYAGTDAERRSSLDYEAFSVDARGGSLPRRLFPTMSSLVMHDAVGGRVLVTREDARTEIVVKRPDADTETPLSWLDLPIVSQLSPDGSLLVFTDQNVKAGDGYAVMIRKTDGSPPVRLGDGSAQRFGLSPDGKWVIARRPGDQQVVAYPTGAGSPRLIDTNDGNLVFSGWFPDSEHFMLCAGPGTTPSRCYRVDSGAGAREPVGPEGIRQGVLMPDGAPAFVLTDGSPVFLRGDEVVRPKIARTIGTFVSWAGAGGAFFARLLPDGARQLVYADLDTGGTTPLTTIRVADLAGVASVNLVSAVGNRERYGYVYTYQRQLSALVEATTVR